MSLVRVALMPGKVGPYGFEFLFTIIFKKRKTSHTNSEKRQLEMSAPKGGAWQSIAGLVCLVSWLFRCNASHQRSFKVGCGRRCPGGRHDAVDGVLLLGVDVLHVERRAVLGLALGLLSVQAAVHATVAILCKECVDGLYPGLNHKMEEEWGGKKFEMT